MTLLIFFILLSIGVSFLCSMLEAVILSVTPSYLASLRENKPRLFERVQHLKSDIEKPLASILTFNTVAHTIGAAGAGAEVQRIFGSEVFALFSALLTFAILFFSEIIPKSIGAGSWKTLLPVSARILGPMIFISYPLVWLSEKVSLLFKTGREGVSRDEIAAMADIGLNDGALARKLGRNQGGFGAFLDSTLDRLAEIILFAGFLFYYLQQDNLLMLAATYIAITGSIMVSYARARAEALGYDCKVGIASRVERYFVMISLLVLNLPHVALVILAVGTYVTLVQRMVYVWKQTRQESE